MTVHRAPEYRELGDHKIVARLGEGGQGVVYLGESPGGARVAIKVLHARLAADPETRRRFLREAEVAASVAAFCTARVLGTGLVDERPYIVSEYVPGPSLDELVKRDGPRTGSGLERLAVSALTALASIHAAGVVHRDFKPANVILGPEGPVVIDFGIARALDHVTSSAHVQGTPSYMPPEQFTDQPLSPASDMFSWAGTMVFAATGRTAFPGSAVPAILHAILHGEPDVSGVPGPLRPLLAACLAKDPAARPAATWLLRELTRGGNGRAMPNGPGGHTIVDLGAAPPGPVRVSGGQDAVPTGPSADHARAGRGPSKGMKIAVVAVAAALLMTAGVLVAPSWLGTRNEAARPVASGVAAPRARLEPGPSLDLATFGRVDVDDRFAGDTSRQYATYRPFSEEAMPAINVGGGRFAASAEAPFFGLMAGRGVLSSDQAVIVLTPGTFAGTGEQEDSIFAGWVKDGDDYVTGWYNNTRGTTGFDVRVGGRFREVPIEIPLRLSQGDRFALMLSGDEIASYVEHLGKWRRLHTALITGLLASPEARQEYRYGFGVRGTSGTISLTRAEGRSVRS
ncbi:serine/threonine protein kinase [Nonomuraea sp. K274]|uniref:Serine/threonine protein kinase n=1 Tax=Nonomuraea cypriaca TaxID=1187855 RepID=A0A931F1B2_9ACTN|nr:serine/threonine-protein kinase [Nonomuraea cypriaca]MBF8190310.1 serine/threonine protein kinase [Nonomuraea cypriaca]